MADHLDTGRRGEALAAEYLRERGFKIIDRNVANPHGKRLGEIDIVAQIKGEIVFVEVKTLVAWEGGAEYLPEHQVTRSKLAKLERIAEYYLRQRGWVDQSYRFDVIAITLPHEGEPLIRHLEQVFL